MKRKKIAPCNHLEYQEFKNLKFGKSLEDDLFYFDATTYLEETGKVNKDAIDGFINSASTLLGSLCDYYSIPEQEMVVQESKTGHVLMEESLALPFLAYLDPYFMIYLIEKISELLKTGFSVSDSMIAYLAVNRLSKDDLNKLYQFDHDGQVDI